MLQEDIPVLQEWDGTM